MLTIEAIKDNEHFEYTGDVHVTGKVGKNATVIIKDGNLTVDGDVDNQSELKLLQASNQATVITSGVSIFGGSVVIGGAGSNVTLSVKGNLGDGVSFNSHNADFEVCGKVGDGCSFKTHNGDISTSDIGKNCSLRSHNGDISCGNADTFSVVKSHNGDVNAARLGENCEASSHNGNVRVVSAPSSAQLSSVNGNVYENGVKRRKEKSQNQTSFSIGNMSFAGGGRIIVNGQDITDIVRNANSSNQAPQPSQDPIRFTKRN